MEGKNEKDTGVKMAAVRQLITKDKGSRTWVG